MEKNVLDFEPHSALFVEEKNPLLFFRAISQLAPEILSPGGSVWLEINERFGAQVARPDDRCRFYSDHNPRRYP